MSDVSVGATTIDDGESTPHVTPAQVLAVITMVVTELVNDQFIDGHWAKLITGLAGIIVPFAWISADAFIQHARGKVKVARIFANAQIHAASLNADATAAAAVQPPQLPAVN